MQIEIENLKDIEQEIKRFNKKLKECKERIEKDSSANYGCRETGALKRAALDLKNELTKITK